MAQSVEYATAARKVLDPSLAYFILIDQNLGSNANFTQKTYKTLDCAKVTNTEERMKNQEMRYMKITLNSENIPSCCFMG